jgi:hypothetical protein
MSTNVSERLLVAVCLAILIFSPTVKSVRAQAGQVTLKPTDDTYVDSSNPDSNYGGGNYLQIMNYNSQINGDVANESIVWLKFNLSSVPEGAVIDWATLQLWTSSVNGSFNVDACSGTDLLNESAIIPWTELTITYSNMPFYNTTSMDSVLVQASDQWYNWSVLDAVRDALKSTARTVTIVLYDLSPHGLLSAVWFDSKESSIAYAPMLTVHWSAIVPEFPAPYYLLLLTPATLLEAIRKTRKNSTLVHKRVGAEKKE